MSDRFERSAWFREARFGLFIHFGGYTIMQDEAWWRSMERVSIDDYQHAIDGFQPENFDPVKWADDAARAGMRYAVMVAKHHEGFCLFDSKLTEYSTMHNGYGRDLVREFLDAFRARGIKVGIYYSLLDWHHPDYPVYEDEHHPHRGDPAWADHRPDFTRYLEYMHGQVEELVTGYGDLHIFWFDFSYGDMVGETWRAKELLEMVRRHQPDILINNRLETSGGGFGSIVEAEPLPWAGDWVSPEQLIPADGIRNVLGEPVPWEACFTHNNNWGYFRGDNAFKSSRTLVRKLVEVVSKGGNMLLNVGPQPDGAFPVESVRTLSEVGEWLEVNGESIYGADAAGIPKPEWGYYTRRGNTLYAHVLEGPIGPLALTGVDKSLVLSARLLATGAAIAPVDIWLTDPYPDTFFVSFGENPQFTYDLPDHIDTVIAIELREHDAAGDSGVVSR
ncbi:alpha-L-fucosidase [Microbacterium sp. CR_7]|uniref:alpha-L-fucosidase n=1 Tax=Microbacterium sp. CR_7 TaxID=3055792 RepID=UPI0035C01875